MLNFNHQIIYLFVFILVLGVALLLFISSNRKCGKQLNMDYFRAKYLDIEHQLKETDQASYALAVLNADKLLDKALRDRGTKGKTMGERLKTVSEKFSDRNAVWQAHKLRNRLSHEVDVAVNYQQAKQALRSFRQALKDLGAI